MNVNRPKVNWSILSFFLFSALLIYGCKKEFQHDSEDIEDTSVLNAKEWYEEVYPTKTLNKSVMGGELNLEVDLSQLIQPDWHKARTYERYGSGVIELPIASPHKFRSILGHGADKRAYGQKGNTKSSFVILNTNGKYEAFVMTLVADSAYLAGDLTKLDKNTYNKRDPKYSGLVLYFSPKGKYLGGWRYKNGELITSSAINPSQVDTKTKSAVNYKPANNEQIYCEDWYWITENEDGVITSVTYMYTKCFYPLGSGGGDDGPPPPKCNRSISLNGKAVTGNAPWEPGPTQPGDDGGFPPPPPPNSTGDGCAVNGNPPPLLDTAKRDTLIDTCAQIRQIKNNMLDAAISQQLTSLKDKIKDGSPIEWGYSQNLHNWPGGNYDIGTIKYGDDHHVTLPITWRSDVGFTLGIIHTHPKGDQPSPQDVFGLLDPLKNSDLRNGGIAAINYYKANFTATIVVYDATYVMKIRDIAQLQALENDFNTNNAIFIERLQTAIRTNGDLDAGFLSIFGKAVNLYKSDANNNLFKMSKLGSDGFSQLIDPCL